MECWLEVVRKQSKHALAKPFLENGTLISVSSASNPHFYNEVNLVFLVFIMFTTHHSIFCKECIHAFRDNEGVYDMISSYFKTALYYWCYAVKRKKWKLTFDPWKWTNLSPTSRLKILQGICQCFQIMLGCMFWLISCCLKLALYYYCYIVKNIKWKIIFCYLLLL